MIGLLVYIVVVLVVLVLALYCVDLIPVGSSPDIKPIIKIVLIVIAILLILARSAILAGLG